MEDKRTGPEHFKNISSKVKKKVSESDNQARSRESISPYISDLEQYAQNSKNVAVDIDRRVQIAIFKLNDEYYALYGKNVREIINPEKIFFVPGTPDTIHGIINVRGDVESVINIKKILGIDEEKPVTDGKIMLARSRNYTCGIIVDEFIEVEEIPEKDIHNVEEALKRSFKNLVQAEFTIGSLVFLLDMEKLIEKVTL